MEKNFSLLLDALLYYNINVDDFYAITIRTSGIELQGFYSEEITKLIRNLGNLKIDENGYLRCYITNTPIEIVLTSNK